MCLSEFFWVAGELVVVVGFEWGLWVEKVSELRKDD